MNIGIDVTYAQSRDSVLIDWVGFLKKPIKTPLEWLAAKDMSARWQTTATAFVSVYLPRGNYRKKTIAIGAPRDSGLRYMNAKFIEAVRKEDAKQALILFNDIQREGLNQTIKFLKDGE